MATTTSHPLIGFYKETASDHRGRYLSDILAWPDEELEYCHDYIQTLFPLPESSGVNWSAPIIDHRVFRAFREDAILKANLQKSFHRILGFYGLRLQGEPDHLMILVGANYPKQSQNWVRKYNHNHLRITRIIRSLRVLGLEEEAQAFFQACQTIATSSRKTGPSDESVKYWTQAATRPLNISPGATGYAVSEEAGPRFLREYERQKNETEIMSVDPGMDDDALDVLMCIDTESNIETTAKRRKSGLRREGTGQRPAKSEHLSTRAIRSKETTLDKPIPGTKQTRMEDFFKKRLDGFPKMWEKAKIGRTSSAEDAGPQTSQKSMLKTNGTNKDEGEESKESDNGPKYGGQTF